MESLINTTSRTRNTHVIRTLVDPHDAKNIESIPLDRSKLADGDGWHYTNNRKYTVKSAYQVEQIYPDMEIMPPVFSPTVNDLKAQCWKV